jgi:hypothetical protein
MVTQDTRSASPTRMVGTETGTSPVRRWRAVLDRLGQTRALAYLVDDTTSWMNY